MFIGLDFWTSWTHRKKQWELDYLGVSGARNRGQL